jgi:hypothetical protein
LIAAQKANKGIGRIRWARVVNASGEHLEPVVAQAVESGGTVCTDAGGGYNGWKGLGYEHPTSVRLRLWGKLVAVGQPRGLSVEALAAGNTPGIGASESLGLLSGRIHVPVQPPHIWFARTVVLSTRGPSRAFVAHTHPRVERSIDGSCDEMSLQASSA